jgi:hypothetical protein
MSKEKKIPLKKVMTGDRGFQQLEMKKKKTEGKKRMVDFQYYLGSAPHASNYVSTTEYIINHLKKKVMEMMMQLH